MGYVKANALAGHDFTSWAALEAHLVWWTREIADERVHGTTGEAPRARFDATEAAALRPLDGRPSFQQVRELSRQVQNDCAVVVDDNADSVPWRLIGERVRVLVADGRVRVEHAGRVVAEHAQHAGRRHRSEEAAHLAGIVGARPVANGTAAIDVSPTASPPPELLRPLAEYEAAVGGGW